MLLLLTFCCCLYTIINMTLPDERYRAIQQTADFLLKLVGDRDSYPRVPRKVREDAAALLRHFPTYYDLKRMEAAAPDVVQEHMDELHRFIVKGQQQE
jgi:hypothetical protein